MEKFVSKPSDPTQQDSNKKLYSKIYAEFLESGFNQVNYSMPPKSLFKDILLQKDYELNFYEFLNDLAKHDKVINQIGN